MPRRTLLALLLATAPGLAHAETTVDVKVDVDVREDPAPSYPPVETPSSSLLTGSRWEGSIAVEGAPMHGFAVDGLAGNAVGLDLTFGRQFGALRVAVEYGVSMLSAQRDLYNDDGWWNGWEDVGGEMHRYGATARLRGAVDTPRVTPLDPAAAVGVYAEAGVGHQEIRWNGGGSLERDDLSFGLGFEIAMGVRRMGGLDVGVRALATRADDGTHDVGILMRLGVLLGL